MKEKFDLLTLGEILMRLSPEENERLTQGTKLIRQIGGAELNVAVGASNLGLTTGMISKIPAHLIGKYVKGEVSKNRVSVDYLAEDLSADARLGLYYYEYGANPRKPQVVYDRKHSSINQLSLLDFPEEMYKSTRCFHTSGITLGLNENVRKKTVEMIQKFKDGGALISLDVNFRANLWSGKEARECITGILPLVDIFFCSESTANLTFGKKGNIAEILQEFSGEYDISVVAATQRIVHSPRKHSFGSIVYEKETNQIFSENSYENIEIIDRIGSGDAYVAGFLYGYLKDRGNCKAAMEYGNAAGAVKNTIIGDMLMADESEVSEIIDLHHNAGEDFEMRR